MKIAIITTDNREHWKKYELPNPVFGTAPEALLQGFEELGSAVEAHVVCVTRKPLNAPSKLADNIYYHSVQIPAWGMMKTLYAPAIWAVRKKLAEIQPDMAHGQGTERDCALSAVFSGFPNVLTIHGNMREMAKLYHAWPGSFHWLAGKLENYVLPRTAGVFCNSYYTQKMIAPEARATWLVPNAIRKDYFSLISHCQRREQFGFINVGVVSERKRQLEILSLFAGLHRKGVPVRIDFVGVCNDGSDYGRCFLREIAIAEKAGYGRYLGTKDMRELIQEMDNANAMIHFPLEEAFGLVVAEGLARGLKFFGTRVGGIPDICHDADGAELYESNDWRGLAEGIKRWVLQGANGFAGAADNQALMRIRYHPLTAAKRHLEIYREVLGKYSRSS